MLRQYCSHKPAYTYLIIETWNVKLHGVCNSTNDVSPLSLLTWDCQCLDERRWQLAYTRNKNYGQTCDCHHQCLCASHLFWWACLGSGEAASQVLCLHILDQPTQQQEGSYDSIWCTLHLFSNFPSSIKFLDTLLLSLERDRSTYGILLTNKMGRYQSETPESGAMRTTGSCFDIITMVESKVS